ncbi:MAG: hypothetical protein O3B86_06880, partial [Planctomycetota bacterium]|nr:hypothetical protein [Planctomycetota bacterium]
MLGRGTFALVERSMRVDTRLARTHLIRLGFALLMLLFLVQVQVAFEKYSAPGRDVFRSICWVNFFLLNLAGISFFSTVITEEKEEMTLGLLRMAGISPVGILMGKVTPRLLGVILLLSVQLPFTFLAITLGGVAVNQILAAYVALLSFAVLLAGLGAFLSTVCARSDLAASLAAATLATIYVFPFLLRDAAKQLLKGNRISSVVRESIDEFAGSVESTTPLDSLNVILTTNYAGNPLSFQVVLNLSCGVVLFGAAWILFDVCTRNEAQSTPARGMMALFSKRVASQSRVWRHALVWKDFNFLTGGVTAVLIKLLAYSILMGGMSVMIARRVQTEVMDNVGSTLMASMLTALIVEIPIYLSRVFREELRWQTWSGLVLLPKSITRVALGKLAGVAPAFLPAILVFIVGAFIAPRFFEHYLLKRVLIGYNGWYWIVQYLFAVHVIVLLSLIVKWGAVPFGISIVVVPNVIFLATAGRSASTETLIVIALVTLVMTITSQW